MMDEQGKIRIIVILNHLKEVINPSLDNDIYQLWLKTNKKVKFRSWCIDKIQEQILLELDKKWEEDKEKNGVDLKLQTKQ